jgi:CheY-like chemotaxis protein
VRIRGRPQGLCVGAGRILILGSPDTGIWGRSLRLRRGTIDADQELEETGMASAAQGDPDPHATAAQYGASRIRGKRILYVDDERFLRRVTSALLGDAGAICLIAGTHDEAMALVSSEPELALAILDFQMPDGDVGRLVKRLRTARAVLPLIGTSAIDRRSEFAERGVTQFLEKPWELGDLVRALECIEFALPARGIPGSISEFSGWADVRVPL